METTGIVIIVVSALLLISVIYSTVSRKSKQKSAVDTVKKEDERGI